MSATTCDSDVAANALYGNLVNEADFTFPSVDLTLPEFQAPDGTGSALFEEVERLTEAALTSRRPRGAGMFDALMEANKAHLQEEFAAGRVTSKEYSEVYVALTGQAMGAAVQYLLSKDRTYYEASLAQSQAKIAQLQEIQGRIELEKAKASLREQQLLTKTREAQYAHTKIMIASEDAKRCLTQKQANQVEYETTNIMPAQLANVVATTSKITADKDQTLYQTASILPEQLAVLTADKNTKVYTVENVLPAQTANITADTEGKVFDNTFIRPESLELAKENVEATRAKTKDTRRDASIINGSIGSQVALHRQQIDSYKRDAEWKVAKGILDTWITQKSLDDGLIAPTSIQDGAINSVMTTVRANLNI